MLVNCVILLVDKYMAPMLLQNTSVARSGGRCSSCSSWPIQQASDKNIGNSSILRHTGRQWTVSLRTKQQNFRPYRHNNLMLNAGYLGSQPSRCRNKQQCWLSWIWTDAGHNALSHECISEPVWGESSEVLWEHAWKDIFAEHHDWYQV